MRILVLDANQRSALAVVRSLSRIGITVLTSDAAPMALAGASSYSLRYLQSPSPAEAPREFLAWLQHTIVQHEIDWVFPATEISSQLILHEPTIVGRARIPFAPLPQVMALADKWELVQLAAKAGVVYPRTVHFAGAAELLPDLINGLTYPIVIKPTQSRRWLGDHWLSTSVHIVHSAAELNRFLQQKDYLRDHPFMLQEFIPGHGAGVFALYNHGRPVTFFSHQRLREKPPKGGVSVLSQSVPLDPEALRHARALLDAVQWHGVAMVEFRVAADGTPYLMEVNTRFWGSLQLAIDAGVDFPALLYRVCNGEAVEPVEDYRIGQRLRWVLGDVDSLYLMLRDPSFSFGQKLRRLLDFFTPHFSNTRHEVNRWGDFGPAWFELRSYLRALRK